MISVIIQYIEYCIRVYIDIYASKALAVVYTAIVEPGTTFNMPNVIQALTVTVLLNYETCTCSVRTAIQIYRESCIRSNEFLLW